MAEGLSPAEVAHTVGHAHAPRAAGWRAELVEILEALLLAVVAVATAWSGYETARWDGKQAELYGLSAKERLEATQASTLAGQQRLYDASVFSFWLQATVRGDAAAASAFERRFRPELRPAFASWLATDPLHDASAPPGPQAMPEYRNAAEERAARHERRATASFQEGTEARHTADEFLRNTVLFATVLFLTALAPRFKVFAVRAALVGVSAVLLGVALYQLATYPAA